MVAGRFLVGLLAAIALGTKVIDVGRRNLAGVELSQFVNAPDRSALTLPDVTHACRANERRPHWCKTPAIDPSAWPTVLSIETMARGIGERGAAVERLAIRPTMTGPAVVLNPADEIRAGFSFGDAGVQSDGVVLPGFGSGFGFLVYVDRPGCYLVAVRARNGMPPPIDLELRIGPRRWSLAFERGDDSWSEQAIAARFGAGRYTGVVRFLNDLFDPLRGLDRNGVVDRLTIQAVPPASCSASAT